METGDKEQYKKHGHKKIEDE